MSSYDDPFEATPESRTEGEDLVSPLPGQVLHTIDPANLNTKNTGEFPELGWDEERDEYIEGPDRLETTDLNEAVLISSQVAGSDKHKVLLDIDLPIKVVPSSTPGHGHLYIDKELDWSDLADLMNVMVNIGLLEEGYEQASLRRGFTSLRLPWIKKEKND